MPVTRFLRRESISERIGGFVRHLRDNGMPVGTFETETALSSMAVIDVSQISEMRMAFKAICCRNADWHGRFDNLFDSFWCNRGRQKQLNEPRQAISPKNGRHSKLLHFANSYRTDKEAGITDEPDEGNGDADGSGKGRLVAVKNINHSKTDLREFMLPEDQSLAEKTAQQLAQAIRYRLSRRRKAANSGHTLDLRRMIRKSLATGGVPVHLARRQRPEKPVNLVAILDVSGSMQVYARVFLAFIKGLISADQRAHAFLFHTNIVCVSDALRDNNTMRAINRLSMMAQGFGGGTKIGSSLRQFKQQHSARTVNSRTVVIILSDGYDTGSPREIAIELKALKHKGARIIWLNPLLGWKEYSPIAAGMQAALPYIDYFGTANTLESLASLESELARM